MTTKNLLSTLVLATAVLAGCDTGDFTSPPVASIRPVAIPAIPNLATWGSTSAVEGEVRICTFPNGPEALAAGAGPGSFTVTASPNVGVLVAAPNVAAYECMIVWKAPAGLSGDVLITVTQVGPTGFKIHHSVTYYSNMELVGDQVTNFFECYPSLANPTGCNTQTATVNALLGATFVYKQLTITTPPPPPSACVGLTPGYWKNWRNHYTAAQFASLLPGTIASTINQADAIFAAKGNNAVDKLKWFVLANQLTLNLTGTNLPNPSNGQLVRTCATWAGGPQLGNTLTIALAIIGSPNSYSNGYILSIKDILDWIANLS